jgi:hypothetical protein
MGYVTNSQLNTLISKIDSTFAKRKEAVTSIEIQELTADGSTIPQDGQYIVVTYVSGTKEYVHLEGGVLTSDITSTVNVGAIEQNMVVPKGMTLQQFAEKLLVQALPPAVSLSATLSDGLNAKEVREKGVPIDATIEATVSKKSNDIQTVVWENGIVATETNVIADTKVYTKSKTGIAETTKFVVKATDIKGKVGTGTLTLTFVDPIRILSLNEDITTDSITETDILAGEKLLKTKGKNKITMTLVQEKLGIAYPSEYGALTKISDVANNLNILTGFSSKTIDIITESGTVEYLVYVAVTPSVITDKEIEYEW